MSNAHLFVGRYHDQLGMGFAQRQAAGSEFISASTFMHFAGPCSSKISWRQSELVSLATGIAASLG